MSGRRPLPLRVFVLAWFLAAGILMAGLGVVWSVEAAAPRVILLGSGGRVSALVTAGAARLLIVDGSSPASFAAALEAARQPVQQRIDVALLAGAGDDLLAAAAVVRDPHVRLAATIGPLDAPVDPPALGDVPAITDPRLIRLGDGVSVLVEPMPADAGGGTAAWAWRATVARGDTRVVLVSAGAAAGAFPSIPDPSMVVVVGGDPPAAVGSDSGMRSPALAFADAALAPRPMRADLGALGVAWAVRVFDGEAIVLGFGEDGLEIPPDAAVAVAGLEETPAP